MDNACEKSHDGCEPPITLIAVCYALNVLLWFGIGGAIGIGAPLVKKAKTPRR